jgi:hypothetical protein
VRNIVLTDEGDGLLDPPPLPFPPYALTCYPDELAAEGFGTEDIERLFRWQDGKDPDATPAEITRFGRLALLVIRNA